MKNNRYFASMNLRTCTWVQAYKIFTSDTFQTNR